MATDKSYPVGDEKKFNKYLVEEYFRHGTVEEVMRKHYFDLPISNASYHRLLDKWGVVKTVGPNSRLSEILDFMVRLVEENIPLERLYKKMPASFRPSAVTLYRVLAYIKEGVTRRVGTGLIITIKGNNKKILMARDVSIPRKRFGKKYGAMTFPIGFSKISEIRRVAIKRLLQQEVFSGKVINRKFPEEVIPSDLEPFMFLDIADVRVEVFHIELPQSFVQKKNYFSYKLDNFRFIDVEKITLKSTSYRVGIVDAIEGYKRYLDLRSRNLQVNPMHVKASINYALNKINK